MSAQLASLTTLHPAFILMSVLFALRFVVILYLLTRATFVALSTRDQARADRALGVLAALLAALSWGLFGRGGDR
ncbi:hypothetical protein [Rhodococcus sp. 27YEA6]|uniref:hypothetical protein n=1 Tax=Rhodococcus sp. 27YEA6 TaxID=3156273 RepID=UPI003834F653